MSEPCKDPGHCARLAERDVAGYDEFLENIKVYEGLSVAEALEVAYGIGIDYDGYRTAYGLKGIIDELMAGLIYVMDNMGKENL